MPLWLSLLNWRFSRPFRSTTYKLVLFVNKGLFSNASNPSVYPTWSRIQGFRQIICSLHLLSALKPQIRQDDKIFMIRRSFQDLSKSAFIPLYRASVRPHLKYGMPACSPKLVADINHLERIQILVARLLTGMHHRLYEERLQRLGLYSLQRRRLRDNLITTLKIFKGLLDVDPNLFIVPPARRGLRGHPYKVLQGACHRRRRGSAFSVRVVKYWNKLPASVVTAPSVNVFTKG